MTRIIGGIAAACALLTAVPAAAACSGAVTIGEILTEVPNKEIGGRCINELIVDTVAEGAEYDSHAEFVARLILQTLQWRKSRSIGAHEAVELIKAAVHSEVGKTITVRVIGFNDYHGNLQSPGTFGVNTVGAGGQPPAGRRRRIRRRPCREAEGAEPAQRGGRRRRLHRRHAADLGAVLRRAVDRDAEPHRPRVQRGRQPRVRQAARPSCSACRTAAARSPTA